MKWSRSSLWLSERSHRDLPHPAHRHAHRSLATSDPKDPFGSDAFAGLREAEKIQENVPAPHPQPAFSSIPKNKCSLWPLAQSSDSGLWADKEHQAGPLMGSPQCPAPLFLA